MAGPKTQLQRPQQDGDPQLQRHSPHLGTRPFLPQRESGNAPWHNRAQPTAASVARWIRALQPEVGVFNIVFKVKWYLKMGYLKAEAEATLKVLCYKLNAISWIRVLHSEVGVFNIGFKMKWYLKMGYLKDEAEATLKVLCYKLNAISWIRVLHSEVGVFNIGFKMKWYLKMGYLKDEAEATLKVLCYKLYAISWIRALQPEVGVVTIFKILNGKKEAIL